VSVLSPKTFYHGAVNGIYGFLGQMGEEVEDLFFFNSVVTHTSQGESVRYKDISDQRQYAAFAEKGQGAFSSFACP